jgi:hypothetical protein
MADATHQPSEQLEQGYKVRQVTAIQASWAEQTRGEPGLFAVQLILDHGVAEYVLSLCSEDVRPLLKLFEASKHTTFDTERKLLMFANIQTE